MSPATAQACTASRLGTNEVTAFLLQSSNQNVIDARLRKNNKRLQQPIASSLRGSH
jgi:hypothetical protein